MSDLNPNQHCTLTRSSLAQEWRNAAGECHRVDESGIQDGPAFITPWGSQGWYFNGLLHRLDGPALVYPDGRCHWFLDGVEFFQKQWAKDIRVIEFHSRTQEGAEQWLTKM